MGELDLIDYLLTKLEGSYLNKGREKIYSTEEAYETYLPKNCIYITSFSSYCFGHLSPSLIKISTEKNPWNKTDKTPIFTRITPQCNYFDHVGDYQDIPGRYGI